MDGHVEGRDHQQTGTTTRRESERASHLRGRMWHCKSTPIRVSYSRKQHYCSWMHRCQLTTKVPAFISRSFTCCPDLTYTR